MSVMSVAMKQTIGIGTSITWSGWPAMLAVERGLGLVMQLLGVDPKRSYKDKVANVPLR
jgi:hypothetical protein